MWKNWLKASVSAGFLNISQVEGNKSVVQVSFVVSFGRYLLNFHLMNLLTAGPVCVAALSIS
jgi:hypothetical protein